MLQRKIKNRTLEQFHEELQRTQDRVPKHDVTIKLGDMNAKLGKEKLFSQVVGRHTLHDISNENGETLANYAISNVMFLISTGFQHRNMHTGTWISADHQTINQIDHVMVRKGKLRLIHDVRRKGGYNCDSDHLLVQIKIKQKLIPVKNRQIQKYKCDRQLINQKEKINKYQENLQSKLQEIEEETDINQDRQNLKQATLEVGTEFRLSEDVRNAICWWDGECGRATREKNEARGKCIMRETRTNLNIYQQKRIKANRNCRRKKKEWIERKIIELNETNRKRDKRKVYKDVRNLSNVATLVCRHKTATYILSEQEQTSERGQQYFKELLNPETERINT